MLVGTLVFLWAFSIGQSLIEDGKLCDESKDELVAQRRPQQIGSLRSWLHFQPTLSMFSCQTIFGVCHNFVEDKTSFSSVPPESTLST